MRARKITIPIWQRLIGILGPVLVTVGVFAQLQGGATVHPLLENGLARFAVLALGAGLMLLDLVLRVRLLKARHQDSKGHGE